MVNWMVVGRGLCGIGVWIHVLGGVASFTRKVTITAPMSIGSQKSEKIEQHSATMEIHAKPLRYDSGFMVLIGFFVFGFIEAARFRRSTAA